MAKSNLQTKIQEISDTINTVYKRSEAILNHTIFSRLPDGYTEIEYVQANGTCYADTLYAPTRNVKFESKVYLGSNVVTYPTIWGARDVSNGPYGIYSHNMSDGLHWLVYTTEMVFSGTHYNKIYYVSNMNNNTINLYDENKQLLSSKSYSAQTSDRYSRTTYLFTLNRNGGTVSDCFSSGYRIYYLKFYENNELVCDIIPCKDKNNVVCFYEAVKKNVLYNKGSGSFIAGPEV